jgi:hypothetical protein
MLFSSRLPSFSVNISLIRQWLGKLAALLVYVWKRDLY